MKIYVVDTETTISNNGNPFDTTNRMVCIGVGDVWNRTKSVHYNFDEVTLEEECLIVAFNAKFDLHWLRRYNKLPEKFYVWDLQLWEFMDSAQLNAYPALNDVSVKRGFGEKLDKVKEEYWNKGIDTGDIPHDVLTEYTLQDVQLELDLFLWQMQQRPTWFNLFLAQCQDLIVLEEMEWNGLTLDKEKCDKEALKVQIEIKDIELELSERCPGVPLNYNSDDHMSAYLYGGIIYVEERVPIGQYKTGNKIGQTRFKVLVREYPLERLVEPVKGSELKKEGMFSTSEEILRKLKPNKKVKRILELLKRRSQLAKLYSTYLIGFPKLMLEMNWEGNEVHGQFNQVRASTGRLSSSNPNLQNIAPEFAKLFVSRYDE